MTNALCDVYLTYAEFHTAVELVDETKVLSTFAFNEAGKTKFVIVKKS